MVSKLFIVRTLKKLPAPYEDHFNKGVNFVKKKMLSTRFASKHLGNL